MSRIFKVILSAIFLLTLSFGLTSCIDSGEWKTVIVFEGTFEGSDRMADSKVFELTGGRTRVTYDLVTTSVGGNALIYVLPEGWTMTQDANGNLKISVQDITAIGDKTNEQKTIRKDPGRYHIFINSSSVESYKIVIEEWR